MQHELTRVEANFAISSVISYRLDPSCSDAFEWGQFVTALDQYLVPRLVRYARYELDMWGFSDVDARGLLFDELTKASSAELTFWSNASDLVAAIGERACRTPSSFKGRSGDSKGWLWRERDRTRERSAVDGHYLLSIEADQVDVVDAREQAELELSLERVAASTARTIAHRNLTPLHLGAPVARAVEFLTCVWPSDRTHAGTPGSDNTRRASASEAIPELTREQVAAVDLLCWGSRPHIERTSLFYAHLKDAQTRRPFSIANWPTHLASVRAYQTRMFQPVLTLAR